MGEREVLVIVGVIHFFIMMIDSCVVIVTLSYLFLWVYYSSGSVSSVVFFCLTYWSEVPRSTVILGPDRDVRQDTEVRRSVVLPDLPGMFSGPLPSCLPLDSSFFLIL